jgi:hypothetical protein
MADKEAQRLPEIYLTVMQARDRETWKIGHGWSPGPGKGRQERRRAHACVGRVPLRDGEDLHMKAGWPYDASTSEIDDRLDEPLADREHLPFEAPAAPVNIPAPRGRTAAGPEPFSGGQATTGHLRSVRYWAEQANTKSCWMCGIRLPADQMVADGGGACPDLRWYCRDTWACTERWTWRSARPAAVGQGRAEAPKTPGEQPTHPEVARPVQV